jgi:bla regulator protein BlaR1
MVVYLIKAIACSGLLIAIYFWLFEKEKNHSVKRYYLLASLIISLLIPAFAFEQEEQAAPLTVFNYLQTNQPTIGVDSLTIQENSFNLIYLLFASYAIVVIYLAARFCINLGNILSTIAKNEKISASSYTIVLVPEQPMPFCFLHYIFLDREAYLQGQIAQEILLHEQAHVLQKHTLDVLFIELLNLFLWFNPFLKHYKKAIQTNHEYLADENVIRNDINVKAYQYLLLQKISQQITPNLSSPFNYLTTKKRLTMMTRTSSKRVIYAKQLTLIPIFALALFLFSNRIAAQQPGAKLTVGTTESTVDGLSAADLKRYKEMEQKYYKLNGLQIVGVADIPENDRLALQKLYLGMSKAQQSQTTISFIKPPKPFSPAIPTEAQFEKFKNQRVYGVWVNDKKVDNSTLNNYKAADFKHYFISKLYGRAKEGRKYDYQLDMMTSSHYDDYYAKQIANQNKYIMVSQVKFPPPTVHKSK